MCSTQQDVYKRQDHVSTVFGRWIPIPQIGFLEFAGIGRLDFVSGQSFCRGRCLIIAFLFRNIRPDPLLRADLPALGRMCFQLEVWTASLSRHPCSIGNQHQRDVVYFSSNDVDLPDGFRCWTVCKSFSAVANDFATTVWFRRGGFTAFVARYPGSLAFGASSGVVG